MLPNFDPPVQTGAPLEAPRRRRPVRFTVLAVALIGLLWSLMASLLMWRWEEKLADASATEAAQGHFLALQNGLNEYLSKLVALRAFFESSEHVTREEFDSFAGRLLEGQSAVQNFSWVPHVVHADRAAFEAAAAANGLLGYGIKEVTPDDRIVVSPPKPEYLPILYSTVADRRSRIYGIDLLSQPVIQVRLDRARDNNQLSAVPDFILHSAEGKVHGFLFSLPVYRPDRPHATVAERRADLMGFAHGAFLTAQAIEHVLTGTTTPAGLDIYLSLPGTAADPSPLHVHWSRLRAPSVDERPAEPVPAGAFVIRSTLKAGDARWNLLAVPIAGGPLIARHDRTWIVLGSSLLLGLIITWFIRSSLRKSRELELANEEITVLAQHDSLTGLVNRRAFTDQLGRAFAECRAGAPPFAVLYFDLDHFKDINDTLGHSVGDRLLKQVAERVQQIVRRGDTVSRFGGDEFAVLQREADVATTAATADRLNSALAEPYEIDSNVVHITGSIGIVQYGPDATTPDALVVQADLALYRAKEDGRNCYRFHTSELDREVYQRVTIADELRSAIERDELRLYYQPQVELKTGRIVGVEGLLRWRHPTRGLISPGLFIPVAERTGTITTLGEWAFEEACRQLRCWSDQHIAPNLVAVNFSASQFKGSARLDTFLSAALDKWRIAPLAIEVELTESVLMEVTKEHSDSLDRLRQLGVRIAIDDFGTGYSSLNYLTSFPVSRLKIAQELVLGATKDARSATVVRAAIRLANELGIECIAEGVETPEQVKFLVVAGCAYGQGYYFERPLSSERMTEVLRDRVLRPRKPRLELAAG